MRKRATPESDLCADKIESESARWGELSRKERGILWVSLQASWIRPNWFGHGNGLREPLLALNRLHTGVKEIGAYLSEFMMFSDGLTDRTKSDAGVFPLWLLSPPDEFLVRKWLGIGEKIDRLVVDVNLLKQYIMAHEPESYAAFTNEAHANVLTAEREFEALFIDAPDWGSVYGRLVPIRATLLRVQMYADAKIRSMDKPKMKRYGEDPSTWSSRQKIGLLRFLLKNPSAKQKKAIIRDAVTIGLGKETSISDSLTNLTKAGWANCGPDGICLTSRGIREASKLTVKRGNSSLE